MYLNEIVLMKIEARSIKTKKITNKGSFYPMSITFKLINIQIKNIYQSLTSKNALIKKKIRLKK